MLINSWLFFGNLTDSFVLFRSSGLIYEHSLFFIKELSSSKKILSENFIILEAL